MGRSCLIAERLNLEIIYDDFSAHLQRQADMT
jgi:hypothetical protein